MKNGYRESKCNCLRYTLYLWWKRNHASSQVNDDCRLLAKAYRELFSSFLYVFPLARSKKRKELYGQTSRLALYTRSSLDTPLLGCSFHPRHTRNTLDKLLPFANADTPVLAPSYKDCSFSRHLIHGATFLWIVHLLSHRKYVTPDEMRRTHSATGMVDDFHGREQQLSGVHNSVGKHFSLAIVK